ncbi:MAG TPA: hypothetical protein PK450_13140 [Paracoccaceae bacterium]|nr:hypothetical protein [Paracoccaceae bacterium]
MEYLDLVTSMVSFFAAAIAACSVAPVVKKNPIILQILLIIKGKHQTTSSARGFELCGGML